MKSVGDGEGEVVSENKRNQITVENVPVITKALKQLNWEKQIGVKVLSDFMMSGSQKGLSGGPASVFYGIFDKPCNISFATFALNVA